MDTWRATNYIDAITMDAYLLDGTINGINNIGMIDASHTEFFMMAAQNDQPPNNPHNNLVDLVTTIHQKISTHTNTLGSAVLVSTTLKIYDDWIPPESGHKLFESVEDGGST